MIATAMARVGKVWDEYHLEIKAYLICIPLLRIWNPELSWFGTLFAPLITFVGGAFLVLAMLIVGRLLVYGTDKGPEAAAFSLANYDGMFVFVIFLAGALAFHQTQVELYSSSIKECMQQGLSESSDVSDSRGVIRVLDDCTYDATKH
jgi:hypothetical protein